MPPQNMPKLFIAEKLFLYRRHLIEKHDIHVYSEWVVK
jgi:hypothetical protein